MAARGWPELEAALERIRREGAWHEQPVVERIDGARLVVDGREWLSFRSNDYLGLGQDAEVRRAAAAAVSGYAWSTSAARGLTGNSPWHRELEAALARFLGSEDAAIFTGGYFANVGLLPALTGPGSFVAIDEACHASTREACKLSGAAWAAYPHGDVAVMERLLAGAAGGDRYAVTDGVFASGGDLSPLPDVVRAARRHGARVLLDDAHGFGVYGEEGRGVAEHFGLEAEIDVRVGTLSKAGGGVGGFVAGARPLVEFLRQRSLPYLYTAALPPAVRAAGVAALAVLAREPERRRRLWETTRVVHERLRALGLDLGRTAGPLVVVWFGSATRTRAAAAALERAGVQVLAMAPPAVPEGAGRLRLALTLHHRLEDLERLYAAMAEAKAAADGEGNGEGAGR
ncbi:MAG: aminotransferase class I/II-fold pyridoxal phosphate-dependent enzyme [Planctomycetes bacterium]|nr:aminotransferase class I/II-fold pyridoxal phosphate-dependent enzyme [Planctomycetota bacterium]